MAGTMNKVMLIGRVGGSVELRYTQAGTAVASFSLATDRYVGGEGSQGREETEWHNIVAWDKLADRCNQYLVKGQLVYIEGRLQTRSWEDQSGQKRYKTEVVAGQMTMLGGKPGGSNGSQVLAGVGAGADDEMEAEELPF